MKSHNLFPFFIPASVHQGFGRRRQDEVTEKNPTCPTHSAEMKERELGSSLSSSLFWVAWAITCGL